MSRTLTPTYRFGPRVNPQSIDEAELRQRSLVAGEEITIWESKSVPSDKGYVWGYGTYKQENGDTNFSYAEFLANGSGTGTDGNVIRDAEVVVALVDSTGEDTLAKTTLGPTAGDFADAKADPRTERPEFVEHGPGVGEDKHLQLRLRAGSGADGKVVGVDSDLALGYGRVG